MKAAGRLPKILEYSYIRIFSYIYRDVSGKCDHDFYRKKTITWLLQILRFRSQMPTTHVYRLFFFFYSKITKENCDRYFFIKIKEYVKYFYGNIFLDFFNSR